MTYPITPMPSIHNDPMAPQEAQAELAAVKQSLQYVLSTIAPQIIELIVNAILQAFGLSKFEGTVDQLVNKLETVMSQIPIGSIPGLVSGYLAHLSSSGIWTDITKINDAAGHPLSGYVTHLNTSGVFSGLANIVDTGSVALSTYLTNIGNTGHWTDVTKIFDTSTNALSTYLTHITGSTGAIAPVGVTNVLGGTSLSNDLTNLTTALFGTNTITTTTKALIASIKDGTGNALSTYLTHITGSSGAIDPAGVTNVLSGTSLANDLTNLTTALFGTNTITTSTKALIASIKDGSNNALSTYLTHITGSSGAIDPAGVTNVLSGTSLKNDLTNLTTALFNTNTITTTTKALISSIEDASTNSLTTYLTHITGSTGAIAPVGVTNVLSGTSLANDLTNLSTALFNTNTVTTSTQALSTSITTMFGNSSLNADIGSVIDNLANGLSGGSGSGNRPSALGSLITQIPHTNVMVPPNPGSGSISHDGNASNSATSGAGAPVQSLSSTVSHTIGSHTVNTQTVYANLLTVKLAFHCTATQSSNVSSNVTYAGQNMALLSAVTSGNLYFQFWGLANPATGANNISVSIKNVLGFSNIECLYYESDSYFSVGSVGSITTNTGTAGTPNVTSMASSSNDFVIEGIAVLGNTSLTAPTSYSGTPLPTSRFNGFINGNNSEVIGLQIGDVAGASTVTFDVAASANQTQWAAIGMNLAPIPSTILGSGFTQYRSLTATVAATAGTNIAPAGFFDQNEQITADLAYNSSTTNTLTIGQSGWYTVVIAYLVSLGGGNSIAPVLYKNGSPYKHGTFTLAPGVTTYTGTVGYTFVAYCAGGDTLQPGYELNGSCNLTGENTGVKSYWQVTLTNRSLA